MTTALNPACPYRIKCSLSSAASCRFADDEVGIFCTCQCVCHGEGGTCYPDIIVGPETHTVEPPPHITFIIKSPERIDHKDPDES